MPSLILSACSVAPFGSYLKGLGVLRLVAEQADKDATGDWAGDTFQLHSRLSREELIQFFVKDYAPTPIVAPWNGGSGFYEKDNKYGIDALAASQPERFAAYRRTIAQCRSLSEVRQGKSADDEDGRRTAILRHCRNQLCDAAVEWLDAAVGIAADGSRSFAPVLGTGGNEGRLDYTNNFMSRISALLIFPARGTPVDDLLSNALFGDRTLALQQGAAGQYDPGRAGGANQGPGVEHDAPTNPWDLILTLEGAVAWSSGLYRRQGVSYRSFLCSPFTVRSRTVGYGSASVKDDARAEIWVPLWKRPARYRELRALLREGRASVQGRPAENALEFAEAASSLGVDRGVERFARFSLLKRRGDSYVALPAGTFDTGYRSESDLIRRFQIFLDSVRARELPRSATDALRAVDAGIFQVLLKGGKDRVRDLMAALGRMLRLATLSTEFRIPARGLRSREWLAACGFEDCVEVRIAAALASVYTREIYCSFADHLSRADKRFAWTGRDLSARLVSVLDRRIMLAKASELRVNPVGGACALHPADATRFIGGAVDDALIEELIFAFATFDWMDFELPKCPPGEVLPVYAVMKHLFLAGDIRVDDQEPIRVSADQRVISFLLRGDIRDAAALAVHRLRVAGLRPLEVDYEGGVNPSRLAASLLIPVWSGKALAAGIFHKQEHLSESYV